MLQGACPDPDYESGHFCTERQEDPATGSANGALGAYLVKHKAIQLREPVTRIITEQGYEVGRPCTIYIEVEHRDESLEVRVGGQVARSLEGFVYY